MSIFKETKNYFKLIADEHKQINGFVHGSTYELRKDVLSKQAYPLLWFGTPFIDIKNTGSSLMGIARTDFVILTNAPDQHTTQADKDQLWADMEQICVDIISRLKKDQRTRNHKINLEMMDMQPVDPLLIDGVIGWRVEFILGQNVNICYDPNKWNNAQI